MEHQPVMHDIAQFMVDDVGEVIKNVIWKITDKQLKGGKEPFLGFTEIELETGGRIVVIGTQEDMEHFRTYFGIGKKGTSLHECN